MIENRDRRTTCRLSWIEQKVPPALPVSEGILPAPGRVRKADLVRRHVSLRYEGVMTAMIAASALTSLAAFWI